MDITLIRQGNSKIERENGGNFEILPADSVTPISKSALRLMYACGKRPLYVRKDSTSWDIMMESKPLPKPDCVVCSYSSDSVMSARILQEQLKSLGVKISIAKSKSMAKIAQSKDDSKKFHHKYIQSNLRSLEKKGLKHIIIIGNQTELDLIFYALTGKKQSFDKNTSMKIISDGEVISEFKPENTKYITEGMYETLLLHRINGENCPEHLGKFKGKVKGLLSPEYLSQKFKTELKQR